MVTSRKEEEANKPRRPPATTLEGRENQLISLAVGLAEKQIREGTASSQVITHFLKLATTREKLEQEKLAHENALLQAKTDSMASARKVEDLYDQAISAMRSYQGQQVEDSYEE